VSPGVWAPSDGPPVPVRGLRADGHQPGWFMHTLAARSTGPVTVPQTRVQAPRMTPALSRKRRDADPRLDP
jgi:hypothetical protein